MLALTLLLALAPAAAPAQDADPEAACLERTRAELARHPYFSKVRLETVVRPPFLFVVQSSPSGGASYAADLAAGYAELLGPLVARFEADYARPLRLVRRPEQPLLPVAVLPTRGDFVNYASAATARGHYFADSLYDRDLHAAVLFESPFDPKRDARTRAHGALHACVHVLAHAWSSGKRTVEPWPWPLEGLADHLARTHPGHRAPQPPNARKDGPLDAGMVEAAVAAALDPDLGWANLWRVADLSMVEYWPQTDGALRMKAKRLARRQPFDFAPYQAYLRHGALLTRFLHTDAEPPLRDAYRELLRLLLTGSAGPAAYAKAFPATPPEELDRLYRTWIVERHRALFPAKTLDAERILRGDLPALPAAAAPTDPGAPEARPEPEPAPAPPPLDPRTLLAMATFDARAGRAATALERLAAAAGGPADDALAARIARAQERIRAFDAYRTDFLDWALESGDRVRIEVEGGRLRGTVRAVAGGGFTFDAGGEERTLALAVLTPDVVTRAAAGTDGEELGPGWMRAWAHLLEGSTKWSRFLRDEEEAGARGLADDAEGYAALLELGEAGCTLEELAELAPPRSPADARERLDRIRAFRERFRGHALVEPRVGELRAAAAVALSAQFEQTGPAEVLAGAYEVLGGNRIRLTYEFDDEAELADFTPADYPELLRSGYPALTAENADAFVLRGGSLAGDGAACLRHPLRFAAPFTLRYTYSVKGNKSGGSGQHFFAVGLCDDGAESFIVAFGKNALQVLDGPHVEAQTDETSPRYVLGAPLSVEVVHDGEHATLTSDGTPVRVPVHSRTHGALFLWIHSDAPIRVHRLELEAALAPGAMDALRDAWVAGQLADF